MNLSARTVLVTLAAAGAALAGGCNQMKPPPVEVPKYEPARGPDAAAVGRQAVGMAGCLAAACHGGPADKLLGREPGPDAWQASGSWWAAADPHTAAYRVLDGELASRIMARYNPGVKATADARCLACHTNPALADGPATPERVALREQGVSCEACHGNAGQWLQPHTGWKGDRTAQYQQTGLTPLYDLGERALNCAGCHVGAPAADGRPVRDMNHDMIAAGHPRLDFDFAEYQRRLPRHWQEKDRTKEPPAPRRWNEAQVWYVGRVAHAEAACRLLESRAARSLAGDERTPWPEFAEFNCAACHHHLRVPAPDDEKGAVTDWRKGEAHLAGRGLGAAPWQTVWPITHANGLPAPARAATPVKDVVALMEAPRPAKAKDAGARARDAARELARTREAWGAGPRPKVADEVAALFPVKKPLIAERVREWDTARQLFFGLAALEYARGNPEAARDNFGQTVDAFRKAGAARDGRGWQDVMGRLDQLR